MCRVMSILESYATIDAELQAGVEVHHQHVLAVNVGKSTTVVPFMCQKYFKKKQNREECGTGS